MYYLKYSIIDVIVQDYNVLLKVQYNRCRQAQSSSFTGANLLPIYCRKYNLKNTKTEIHNEKGRIEAEGWKFMSCCSEQPIKSQVSKLTQLLT